MTTESKVFKVGYLNSEGKTKYMANIKLATSFSEATKEAALQTFAKSFVQELSTGTPAPSQFVITSSVAVGE